MQRRSLIRRGVVDVRVGLRGEARNYWYRYTIPLVSERWQDELLITNRRRCDVHCCEWWLLWWPFMLMCSLRACQSGAAAGLLFIASSPSMSCCPTPGRSSRRMPLVDTPTIRPNPSPTSFTCPLAACTAFTLRHTSPIADDSRESLDDSPAFHTSVTMGIRSCYSLM